MALKNKAEVRLYFETHNLGIKEVAAHFGMSYRTLAYWVKEEGWTRGKGIETINGEVVKNGVVTAEMGSVLDVAKRKIRREIESNLDIYAADIDEVVKANLLDSASQEVLLMAISQGFIQKNIMLSGLLAKDELMRMNALRNPNKPDPMFIACAEKVAKIFESMQVSLFGKDIPKLASSEKNIDYSKMSEEELLAIING